MDPALAIEEFYERFDDYLAEIVEQAGGDGITRAELRRLLPGLHAKSEEAVYRAIDRLVERGCVGKDLEERANVRGVVVPQWVIRSA